MTHGLRTTCWAALTVVAIAGVAPRTWASCNTIPPVPQHFESSKGMVDKLLAAPEDDVEITAPGTAKFPVDSKVYLKVGASAEVEADVTPPGSPSRTLTFRVPAGIDKAGPTTITVRSGGPSGNLHAKIDAIRGTAFGERFIVLPRANALPAPDVAGGTLQTIRATLDEGRRTGRKSLLIPLSHTRSTTHPSGPYGAYRRGKPKDFAAQLAGHRNDDDLVQVYTIEGRRLPPMAIANANGLLVGIAKQEDDPHGPALRSVLRIDGDTCPECDFGKYVDPKNPDAPLVFDHTKFELPTSDWEAGAIDLRTLRSSRDALAFARDNDEVVTVGLDDALSTKPKPTGRTLLGRPRVALPLAVSGTVVGALVDKTSSDGKPGLETWSVAGANTNVTGGGADIHDKIRRKQRKGRGRRKESLALDVAAGRPGSVENVAAYFLDKNGHLRTVRPTGTAGTVDGSASDVAVDAGRVAWTDGKGPAMVLDPGATKARPVGSGTVSEVALSESVIAYAVPGSKPLLCVQDVAAARAEQCFALSALPADLDAEGDTVVWLDSKGALYRVEYGTTKAPLQPIVPSGVCDFVLGETLLVYRKRATGDCDEPAKARAQPLFVRRNSRVEQPGTAHVCAHRATDAGAGFEWMQPYLVGKASVLYFTKPTANGKCEASPSAKPQMCLLGRSGSKWECSNITVGGPYEPLDFAGAEGAGLVFEFAGHEIIDLSPLDQKGERPGPFVLQLQ